MSSSQGFSQLHEGVQRWIWSQNWSSLRDIQERAIDPILAADRDVIISASTASGKTEAAFLPALSRVATEQPASISILYISPLKALINDQYRRLQGLCELIHLPLTPWHGDVLQSVKSRARRTPRGVLLITPESIESLLLNQGGWCIGAFSGLSYIIIDEFHAFLGSERGCQLQSLLHRLEFMLKRPVPRIALSATLGDMAQVIRNLRPDPTLPSVLIESTATHADLKIQLRGYVIKQELEDDESSSFDAIKNDLFSLLRGKSNLIFANSRNRTEDIAVWLSDRCNTANLPNEFFPHHGSLSKDLRESLEARLQSEKVPTSAICTMTLELGIDIGKVDSIAQVTAPHSVASLRQRIGRSGRRGNPAVLRLFIPEMKIAPNIHLVDRLRMQTVQCVAMINLLAQKWYEPAQTNLYHFSTLIQQILSVVGQYGGVRAAQLWILLCETGPFRRVDKTQFATLLRALGEKELVTQTQDGQLVLGYCGEKLVEHFTFYAAFNTPEEYRLECDGKSLGALPIDKPVLPAQHLIFAGKRWEVVSVEVEKKLIVLKRAKGGKPPSFDSDGPMLHDEIRREMRRVYLDGVTPAYLDNSARTLFKEGIACFYDLGLGDASFVEAGNTTFVLPWLGDCVIQTITVLLQQSGFNADFFSGVIEVKNCTESELRVAIDRIYRNQKPSASDLAAAVPDSIIEKHDMFVPVELRRVGYGAKYFDVEGAWQWMRDIFQAEI